jgi:hypothetical protein
MGLLGERRGTSMARDPKGRKDERLQVAGATGLVRAPRQRASRLARPFFKMSCAKRKERKR